MHLHKGILRTLLVALVAQLVAPTSTKFENFSRLRCKLPCIRSRILDKQLLFARYSLSTVVERF